MCAVDCFLESYIFLDFALLVFGVERLQYGVRLELTCGEAIFSMLSSGVRYSPFFAIV